MSEFFLDVVNMSISASWLVLAVLALRLILKKAPRWVNVLLWGIVAVRLMCPFSIESALSLIPSTETIPVNIGLYTTPAIQSGVSAIDAVVNPAISQSNTPMDGASVNPLQITIAICANIWILGILVMLIYTAVSYWRLRRKVATAVPLRDKIYQCETVKSPFVLGIIKPRIYLPFSMAGENLKHVVAHEQTHIKRKDHWWKPLGFLLLTIHWFNPLMWLAYILLCRDIELACDEKVIVELGNEQRADYTQALVACAVNRRMIAACPLAFGEVGVKERVKSVMNYKKPAFWIVVVAVIACVVVAVCFLTNPAGFQFDEEAHTIVSANHFDMRNADDAVAVEMNPAQISELSSRLAGVKNTKRSDEYGGFTPGYQISAHLEDGTYIRISGYSLSENDMVDIAWNGDRYVVSDSSFQNYLSRICAGEDISEATPDIVTFEAEVLEIHEGYFLVAPEVSWALNSADQIEVPLMNMDPALEPQVGDTIEIVCSGEILETYPARLQEVYSISVIIEAKKWNLVPMVMVDGKLYLDTGLSSNADARCGVMDGEITSTVDSSQRPIENNQSNFGAGYGYQIGATEGTIEIYMNGEWWIFATEDVRQELQFPTTETAFEFNFAGNTSGGQKMELTEDKPYWCITVVNTGTNGITIDVAGQIYMVDAGTTGHIYPDKAWDPGTYSVSFGDTGGNGMVGNAVCSISSTPFAKEGPLAWELKVNPAVGQALTQEEIDKFNNAFSPLLFDKQGEPIGTNPWTCFFTSYYSDVRDMNFEEFLRYFPGDGSAAGEAEFAALRSVESWPFAEVETLEDMPVPVHKYPARLVNAVLGEYAGISTDDLNTSGVPYLPEYDAYYNYTSDFGPGMFACTRGERNGNTVYLYEETEYGTDLLILQEHDDSYRIVAHQHIAD